MDVSQLKKGDIIKLPMSGHRYQVVNVKASTKNPGIECFWLKLDGSKEPAYLTPEFYDKLVRDA